MSFKREEKVESVQEDCGQDLQELDMMPSFGDIQAQTEDIRRGSLAIGEELSPNCSQHKIMTRRTVQV